MKLRVSPSDGLGGTVTVPPSKSYTHRAIILASLAKGASTIRNPLLSEDTLASIDACRKIGAQVDIQKDRIEIKGVFGAPKAPTDPIDVKNSGTTLRVMTPVCSLCSEKVTLTGDDSIRKRPMQPLLDALEQLKVKTSSNGGFAPVSVLGPLAGGRCRIVGDISSQFISGLLVACALAQDESSIDLLTPIKSQPYVDLTVDVLNKFSGQVEKGASAYRIPGRQIFHGINYEVEGDYSSAAFLMVAAAILGSDVTVTNISINSKQGDRRIIDILRAMGVNVQVLEESVTIRGAGEIDGIQIDLGDSPDLLPIIAVIGALANGKTLIKNVGHLRYKESDRLKAITTELNKMGAHVKEGKDFLEIKGVERLNGAHLSGWKDHRIVMALSIAALRAKGETVIDDAESIPVSFPGFDNVMRSLGADMDLID
jgi:3-phosphoshikimate 1-carboxyvinyltransferase